MMLPVPSHTQGTWPAQGSRVARQPGAVARAPHMVSRAAATIMALCGVPHTRALWLHTAPDELHGDGIVRAKKFVGVHMQFCAPPQCHHDDAVAAGDAGEGGKAGATATTPAATATATTGAAGARAHTLARSHTWSLTHMPMHSLTRAHAHTQARVHAHTHTRALSVPLHTPARALPRLPPVPRLRTALTSACGVAKVDLPRRTPWSVCQTAVVVLIWWRCQV